MHMARTPVLRQGLSNAWLKSQGLVIIKAVWIKAQGYATRATTGFVARANLLNRTLQTAWWAMWGPGVRNSWLPD